MLGVNLNQSCSGSDPQVGTYTPTGTGIAYDISNSGNSPLRIQIQGPNGATDPTQRWCSTVTAASGTIPWSSFNTKCWDGSGAPFSPQPLTSIAVLVPGNNAATVPFSFCINSLSEATSVEAAGTPVYSGGTASEGVFGMHDLAVSSNSETYRSLGGKLYIHEIGWANTSESDRQATLKLFPDAPIYETGQNQLQGALQSLVKPYWPGGAYVTCVNMNIDNGIGVASVADMQTLHDQAQGLTRYVGQYYSPNDGTSFNTPFSDPKWNDLRTGAQICGALCIDAPPQYYLASAPAYQQFTADEVSWAVAQGIVVVFSLFPMQSGDYWQDTQNLITNLKGRGAVPSIWAVNGYYGQESDAIHPIGDESNPNDSMYTALKLLQSGY